MSPLHLTPAVVWSLLGETLHEWYEDRAPRLGAALAYYTVFAMAPGLILIIALTALVLGKAAAQSQIIGEMQDLVGVAGAQVIRAAIESAGSAGSSLHTTALGAITLVFGLWGVFGELQDALNTIWGVTARPGRGVFGIIKARFWSFTVVVGVGFLLLVSLAASAWLAALAKFFSEQLPLPAAVMQVANALLSFAVIGLMFAVIYRLLPDVRLAWRNVWIGAAVTALLFTLGKALFGLYLGRSAVTSVYGAAGSFVVILLWIYYSAQVFFFGAEFTKVYSRRFGVVVVPDPAAVPRRPRRGRRRAWTAANARCARGGGAVAIRARGNSAARDGAAGLAEGLMDRTTPMESNDEILDDPAATLALLKLDAVVGVKALFDSGGALVAMGITCALCPSTVDDSFAPGIGRRLDGWANQDLDVGLITSLAPNLQPIADLLRVDVPTVKKVLTSWGPGKYDAELDKDGKAFRPDGKPAATLSRPPSGWWGRTSPRGGFRVGHVLECLRRRDPDARGGQVRRRPPQGPATVPRRRPLRVLEHPGQAGPDHAEARPRSTSTSLRSRRHRRPRAATTRPRRRGASALFTGKARCATCHVPPLFTEPGHNLHAPADIGIDSFQADRSPTRAYRTAPLRDSGPTRRAASTTTAASPRGRRSRALRPVLQAGADRGGEDRAR